MNGSVTPACVANRRLGLAATVGVVAKSKIDRQDELLENVVERLDEEIVRWLLVQAATDHHDVARAIRLEAATPDDRLAVLKSMVDGGLRTRRFLDYGESSGWAMDAAPIVDALATAVETAPSRELVALLERAIGHVVKVILHADDSDGMIGDLARRLLELHEQICDAGVADPVALARWMARFDFDDQDFFNTDPVRYAAALGEQGLDIYRAEIAKRPAGEYDFARRYAIERLAVLDRDVERIIELLGGEMTAPHQFIKVAEAMLEIDRPADALVWARRGIHETTGWQVAKLYDLAAGVLDDRGDSLAVLDLRREQHQAMASASTYRLLHRAADAVGAWPAEIQPAREVLGLRDRGGLVDVLLADGETDAAWSVATSVGPWEPGADRWGRLAEARETTDPAAAMEVYLRLSDESLVRADRRNYQEAVRHLKSARRAAEAAGHTVEFSQYLAALREQHRRRPTLIQMLDKSKLR